MVKRIVSIISLLLSGLILMNCGVGNKDKMSMLVYVGTYTEIDSQGVELYKLNPNSGQLEFIKTFSHIPNPSYLRLTKSGHTLFAVNELVGTETKPEGTISAFWVHPESGDLEFITSIPSEGRAPCYLTISKDDRFLLVNNYLGGSALSMPVKNGGVPGQPVSVIHLEGSGPVKGRQDASHVHSVNLDPQNRFALIADLGTDRLSVYAFDSASGQLSKKTVTKAQTAPGAGPRHVTFSADGTMVFVANELNSTVETFRFDGENGLLKHIQTISTLPADFDGSNYPADIHLSPDGRFLYVSNRGHESIAIFSVDETHSELTFIATRSVFGSWPRNFVLSRDGRVLLVANQKSRNIVVFRRDEQNGLLKKLSETKSIAAPACLVIKER